MSNSSKRRLKRAFSGKAIPGWILAFWWLLEKVSTAEWVIQKWLKYRPMLESTAVHLVITAAGVAWLWWIIRDKPLKNRTIDVIELARERGGVLSGLTFLNCTLVGPAVLHIMGGGIQVSAGCIADQGFSLITHTGPDQLSGTIAVRDCHFISSTLRQVALAGKPEVINKIAANFTRIPKGVTVSPIPSEEP